jgi:hypothetical protein
VQPCSIVRYIGTQNEKALVVDSHHEFFVFLIVPEHDQLILTIADCVVKAAEDRDLVAYYLTLVALEKHAFEVRLIFELIYLTNDVIKHREVRSAMEVAA